MRGRLAVLALFAAFVACTEQFTAPGVCPDFCPGDSIETRDTIFADVIERDSAFRGYLPAHGAEVMAIADLPAAQSRGLFLLNTMITRVAPVAGDTATVPITVDSARLRLVILRRDTLTPNLILKLYRLPLTIDSLTDFAAVASDFAAQAVDSVNVNDLLARPPVTDTATVRFWGDTIRTDSAGHVLQISDADSSLVLFFELDTLQAPFVVADSGKVAYGIWLSADSLATISVAASETVVGPFMRWFYHYEIPDTLATPDSVVHSSQPRIPRFDSFVFTPPTPALDSNLAVGGVPSARSLLRVAMPAFLRDSNDVVRATLLLTPVAAVPGAPSDSFDVIAYPVLTDVGAKSPRSPVFEARTTVHIGSTDTVRIELTDLIRLWAQDTSAVTSIVLGQVPEAASYTEIRFYSSRAAAFRPALHVTYVKRFPFGEQ